MFQNAFIDIAIGLILMYLVLSLVCTVINEFVATQMKLRAKGLKAALQELIDDPGLKQRFYDHGLIANAGDAVKTASRDMKVGSQGTPSVGSPPYRSPPSSPPGAPEPPHLSYLSGETFALALIGSLDIQKSIPGIAQIEDLVKNHTSGGIQSALLAHLTSAQGDLDAFRKNVASWFDDSMDRISGVYKRKMKLFSVAIGMVVAVLVNADSFNIASALWSDSALRQQMVQAAGETVQKGLPPNNSPNPDISKTYNDVFKAFTDANNQLRPLPIGWHWASDESPPKPSGDAPKLPAPDAAADAQKKQATDAQKQTGTDAQKKPQTDLQKRASFDLVDRFRAACKSNDYVLLGWIIVTTILGWIATGFALSLGAPFWFDMLSKFMNIRGAGPKPERTDVKPAAQTPRAVRVGSPP